MQDLSNGDLEKRDSPSPVTVLSGSKVIQKLAWPSCHEFELVPLKTCRKGKRCTLNLSRAQTSSRWCDVLARRVVPAQVSSLSLDHSSKLRSPSTKALE
ncbi:hypothetical protein TNCV_4751471 [Trichonephila clavipes]|nr:hypothetical protein TNCV_4751471 [Trichonephila clavipes]